MWIVCITSVRHVLTVNGYGGRQTKENEKSWCFKGWETLVNFSFSSKLIEKNENNMGADANCTSSHSILSQNQKRKANCSAHRYPSS